MTEPEVSKVGCGSLCTGLKVNVGPLKTSTCVAKALGTTGSQLSDVKYFYRDYTPD